MLGKQYALDAVEKSNLQKCLDSMQHCIKVMFYHPLLYHRFSSVTNFMQSGDYETRSC